ncbi:MAG: ferritin-like domain-containing protein [Terriglobia bacterium]
MDREKIDLLDLPKGNTSRRGFGKVAGLTGLAAVAGATLLDKLPKAMAAGGINDFEILQFALNLEYLEAEFYTRATTGKTIQEIGIGVNGSGNFGATTGGKQVDFSSVTTVPVGAIAKQIAFDEQTHVKYLRAALASFGVQPIAKPKINLDALGVGFGSPQEFLAVARALEDIGVTAYGGAAPLLQNRTVLGAAARILAAEALHSGNIRLQVALLKIKTTALDGVDILPPPSGTHYFSVTDSSAQTEVRTPGQVLFIAYGGKANAMSGGFFPNGVNGAINTSASHAA